MQHVQKSTFLYIVIVHPEVLEHKWAASVKVSLGVDLPDTSTASLNAVSPEIKQWFSLCDISGANQSILVLYFWL
jgi:hypothetical protein